MWEAIAAAHTEAGGILAGFRHAAGLSQVQFGAIIGHSGTAVAHAERAVRPVSALGCSAKKLVCYLR